MAINSWKNLLSHMHLFMQSYLLVMKLHAVSVCSGNTGNTLQCTIATGKTLDSEESDGGDEV
jgi:hypothetical protein